GPWQAAGVVAFGFPLAFFLPFFVFRFVFLFCIFMRFVCLSFLCFSTAGCCLI
ncbi:hypothetical protein V1519DRAFT_438435, partial [Lipomyces tetrasporus]